MGKKKVALFIDAENISADYAKFIFDNAATYGKIAVKRIYANWRNGGTKPWDEAIVKYSLEAIQCPCFVAKKNSSDMYLIADALEVLYEEKIDTFVIVSEDSDFLPLVQKLKKKGKKILGFGTQKTIKPYADSFNKFIYFEPKQKTSKKQDVAKQVDSTQQGDSTKQENPAKQSDPTKQEEPKKQEEAARQEDSTKLEDSIKQVDSAKLEIKEREESKKQENLPKQNTSPKQNSLQDLYNIIDELIELEGVATYSQIGAKIKEKFPNFSYKKYGYPTLKKLINNEFLPKNKKYQVKKINSDFYLTKKNTKWNHILLKIKTRFRNGIAKIKG